jgi:hypothetical protein
VVRHEVFGNEDRQRCKGPAGQGPLKIIQGS